MIMKPLSFLIFIFIISGCSLTVSEEAPEKTPIAEESTESTIEKQTSTVSTGFDGTNMGLTLPDGFRISLFTPDRIGQGQIRLMAFSPDGILFVSLSGRGGLYGEDKSGGAIFALPDRNHDGLVDEVKPALTGLNGRPHGLAFYNGYLYLAEEDTISRYLYLNNGVLGRREVIVSGLPKGSGHVSRTIGFSPTGKMYFSIGSSCNVCEEQDNRRAAILEFDPDGSNDTVFATGIRNAVGFVFHPVTGEMWATENSRDWLGDDLPPDEINIIKENSHYGWPYCYGKKIADPEYNNKSFCSKTEASVYDLQAHSAPLGLRFIEGRQFPQEWHNDLLVAYHGSWNRKVPTGYKIVRLDVEGNSVIREEDFITGWLKTDESVIGRPVDVIFDSEGALYISDDKLGVIYRVTRIQE